MSEEMWLITAEDYRISKVAVCSFHLQGETQVLCRTLARTQHLVGHVLWKRQEQVVDK